MMGIWEVRVEKFQRRSSDRPDTDQSTFSGCLLHFALMHPSLDIRDVLLALFYLVPLSVVGAAVASN